MRRFLAAVQFLTIFPVRTGHLTAEAEVHLSLSFFVAVGLVQGALLIAVSYAVGHVFDPGLTAAITLLVLVLSNGGFHLDGLSDTFDALAARGGREKKLSVMKDGAAGPVGVAAIFFSLLIKYLAIKNLALFPEFTLYFSLLFMPAISKLAMVISMYYGKSAREDGLGRLFVEGAGFRDVLISALTFLGFMIAVLRFSPDNWATVEYLLCALEFMAVCIVCQITIVFFRRRFGGLTGDTLGATGEISEITFLLVVIVWSRLFI